MRLRRRLRPTSLLALLLSAAALGGSGCLYKFSGGGLPAGIKTVAVLPFENQTPEPALTQEVTKAVREAVESRLGLRAAGEDQADAVVRGSIQRYDPDQPVSFTGQTPDKTVEVTRRMVRITLNVSIVNQKENKVLWEKNSLVVEGEYDPNKEPEGRKKALEKLINDIVDGAQSQW